MTTIPEQLAVYRDLTPSELATCLGTDPTGAERLAAYQTMDYRIITLPDLKPERSLQTAFYQSLQTQSQLSHPLLTRLSMTTGQLVAVLVLAILVIGAWLLFSQQAQITTEPILSGFSCPISPIEQIWSGTGSMAGEFPVWMTSKGQQSVTLLSTTSGQPEQVSEGVWSRALLLVDEDVMGDLVITGQQVDGTGQVFFLHRVDDETVTWEPQQTISNAHISVIVEKPLGRVQHIIAWGVTNPGCYQLTLSLAEYTVPIVVEVVDDTLGTPTPSPHK